MGIENEFVEHIDTSAVAERNLIAAVVWRAWEDLRWVELRSGAYRWFKGLEDEDDPPLKFSECCRMLGMDRERLLRAVEKRVTEAPMSADILEKRTVGRFTIHA